MHQLELIFSLPKLYDQAAILQFHQRDNQAVAELSLPNGFAKGFMWQAQAMVVEVRYQTDKVNCLFLSEQALPAKEALQKWAEHFLGLKQAVAAFVANYQTHTDLAKLFAKKSALSVAQAATPFEAVTWAIMGQQVSVHAAVAMRRKLIQQLGQQHAYGLYCYPNPQQLAHLSEDQARACGLSSAKYQALQALVNEIQQGRLSLALNDFKADPSLLMQQLLAIKGIGPWTVNYTLMRGFAYFDGSLHGDLAVRRNLAKLQGKDNISAKEAEQWLANFQHKALAAAYLWAMEADEGY